LKCPRPLDKEAFCIHVWQGKYFNNRFGSDRRGWLSSLRNDAGRGRLTVKSENELNSAHSHITACA
jgi:hypothetical protein